ncbi:type II toxin-antitoxin system VapC family toxin [Methylobacterium oryzae CBMB20]
MDTSYLRPRRLRNGDRGGPQDGDVRRRRRGAGRGIHPRRRSANRPHRRDRRAALALAAHARYGKGRHPARLNLGDCFAYACARVHGVPLLYVGDDFPQTDIRSALG